MSTVEYGVLARSGAAPSRTGIANRRRDHRVEIVDQLRRDASPTRVGRTKR
jgi:hypothetical protein